MINLNEYILLLEEYSAIKGKQIKLKKENKKQQLYHLVVHHYHQIMYVLLI